MAFVSIVVLIIAFFNPPQIFWIMYFGGTVIASSWGAVAISSVWSDKISETGAFWGMLLGFLGCVIPKTYSALSGATLPIYLDPFFIGIFMSFVGIVAGSKSHSPSAEELNILHNLHIRPESEKDSAKDAATFKLMYVYLAFGVVLGVFFLVAYALPYTAAMR